MAQISHFTLFAVLALFAQLPMTGSVCADEMPTVMAMGDSITEGGRTFVCYREFLVPALRKKGLNVTFVGPKKDATSAHAGYGGKNTTELLAMSKKNYAAHPADIVLLHSGHNSFNKDNPVPRIVRETEAIIKNIREINPDVTILLAQVIPSGKLPKYAYIPDLNRKLESLSKRLQQTGARVVLVDQADGFDWKKNTISDKVHPNASGAKKMADRWMAALLSVREGIPIARTETVRLWDGPAPHTSADIPEETELPNGRVSNVSVPTLDVYHPEKPNGTALMICSGGGYKKLASGPLGLGAAREFLKDGYTVFSLKYRLSPPSDNVVRDATADGARAIRLVRSRAQEWGINPNRIGMIGFSAGSNMILNHACTADAGDPSHGDAVERLSSRPNFMVLACLWRHQQRKVTDFALHAELPPTLMLHAADDKTAPIVDAQVLAEALIEQKVSAKFIRYETGGHMAFNFPISAATADWPLRFRSWLQGAFDGDR